MRFAWFVLILPVLAGILLPAQAAPGQRQARLSWWDRAQEKKAGHYWFKTDLPASEAEAYAFHMNLMYEEYSGRLASLPERAPEKLNVLMFADRDDYELTLRVRYGIDAAGTGGMFFVTGQGSGLAFWTGDLPARRVQHVIQHEGFHQFAYSRFGSDLPVWVNEGMAELFGESMVNGKRLILGQRNPRVLESVQNAIELDRHVPFRRMLTMDSDQWGHAVETGAAAVQYEQAWSMVHFLVYAQAGRWRGDFERYLRLINNGSRSYDAFVRAFGTDDVEAFEQRWKEYILASGPSAFIVALERIEFLAEGALELSRRKIRTDSLESLREVLMSINFECELNHSGIPFTLGVADGAVFTIPDDELTPTQPMFEVGRPKLTGTSKLDKRQEEELPSPPTIATSGLEPYDLRIEWTRDRKTNTLWYEIVAR